MAHSHVISGEGLAQGQPKVRTIGLADLKDALAHGWDDFAAMPSHAFGVGSVMRLSWFAAANAFAASSRP